MLTSFSKLAILSLAVIATTVQVTEARSANFGNHGSDICLNHGSSECSNDGGANTTVTGYWKNKTGKARPPIGSSVTPYDCIYSDQDLTENCTGYDMCIITDLSELLCKHCDRVGMNCSPYAPV